MRLNVSLGSMNTSFDYKTCRKCFYSSDHPLSIMIDDNGICSGCRIHEEKSRFLATDRLKDLKRLVGSYLKKEKNVYDCIIPVTGGEDSFFIVDFVQKYLGLRPLLICFNSHFISDQGFYNLARLRTQLGCDFYLETPNIEEYKDLVKTSLKYFGNLKMASSAGMTSLARRVALDTGTPLIIWGAHQAIEQVGMFSHFDDIEMTHQHHLDHDLLLLK